MVRVMRHHLANFSNFAFLLLVACGGGAASGGGTSSPGSSFALLPGDIAITNVSVVPMSREGVLEHHTVVVRGDRIVAVAPSASIGVPAGDVPAGVTAID